MNIILLGPPGAGKGTQAERICRHYGIPMVSTGDLLRKEVAEDTSIGREIRPYMVKGLLVPDEFANRIVETRLRSDDCKNGFFLDGYPRNVDQAVELDKVCPIDAVLYLELNIETAQERLGGRRSCPKCGSVYHIKFNPPKVEGICDSCGEKLVQREDDRTDTITKRFETYEKETMPLLNYYSSDELVKRIDAGNTIEETFEQIRSVLDGIPKK